MLIPLNTSGSLLGSQFNGLKSVYRDGVDGLNWFRGSREVTRWGLEDSTILVGYQSHFNCLTVGGSEHIGSLETLVISRFSESNAIVDLNIGAVSGAFLVTFVMDEFSAVCIRAGSSGD